MSTFSRNTTTSNTNSNNSWCYDNINVNDMDQFIDNVLDDIEHHESQVKVYTKPKSMKKPIRTKRLTNTKLTLSVSTIMAVEQLIDTVLDDNHTKNPKQILLNINSMQMVNKNVENRFGIHKINKIHQSSKDIVFGYLKQIQLLLPHTYHTTNTTLCSILYQICLLYYSNIEYFTELGKQMTTTNNNHIIDGYFGDGTSYGNIKIKSYGDGYYGKVKYIWTFKLLLMDQSIIAIGIDSSNKKYKHLAFHDCNNKHKYYASEMIGMGSCSFKYCKKGLFNSKEQYGDSINDGDQIKMILNMKYKTLRFYINNIDQGIAYDNIYLHNNITYYMAVYGWRVPRITLTDFKKVYC